MSREIKFRAWDGFRMTTGRMYFDNSTGFLKDDDVKVMQFTGLKDKNGKEIYEGDILSNNSNYKGPASIVKWDNEGAHFHVYRGKTSSGYTLRGEVKRVEIIGNIFENPKLTNDSRNEDDKGDEIMEDKNNN